MSNESVTMAAELMGPEVEKTNVEGLVQTKGVKFSPAPLQNGEGEVDVASPKQDESDYGSDSPVSTAEAEEVVPTRGVRFPDRNSLIHQIFLEKSSGPASSETMPEKGLLKSFNVDSIRIDQEELHANTHDKYDHYNVEHNQPKENQGKFLADYGLSEVMTRRATSKCSKIYSATVLLDSGPWMKKADSKFIEGHKNQSSMMLGLPDDKKLATNADYDLRLVTCQRFEALKDISFFLIHLGASMGVPTTFELFSSRKKGKGRAFRRIGKTPHGASAQGTAEDYIPLGDQVESAMELIENYAASIVSSPGGSLKLIEDVKRYYDDEQIEIKKHGGNMLVIVMTSVYPWGKKSAELAGLHKNFVSLLNEFADLPVTFVFFVETREVDIINYYDELPSPESGVKADVKIAKGLGLMIDGARLHNPWLNYCLPMHLCQTLGICSNILSQAASRPLSAAEIRDLCNTFIGEVPDPGVDLGTFLDTIDMLMSNDEHTKWSPTTGKDALLVDVAKLRMQLSPKPTGCGCIIA